MGRMGEGRASNEKARIGASPPGVPGVAARFPARGDPDNAVRPCVGRDTAQHTPSETVGGKNRRRKRLWERTLDRAAGFALSLWRLSRFFLIRRLQSVESRLGSFAPLVCGLAKPVCGLCAVLNNTQAVLVQHTEIDLGVSVPLVCGHAVPACCLLVVLAKALSKCVGRAEIDLGFGVTLVSSFTIPACGLNLILCNALANGI